jgi:hypothetical protein
MNIAKLKQAQEAFYSIYPQGFDSPQMVQMGKRHKMDKTVSFAHEAFSKKAVKDVEETADNMVRLVARSSMVSLFEKPKYRDAVRDMDILEKTQLVHSLDMLLHRDEERGFNLMLEVLLRHSLAKWTLITVFRCYYYPETDLLYKPTTVKKVIEVFELEGMTYKPRPSYEFFVKYRDAINEMKMHVDENFRRSNAAFSGFLMMAADMI